MITTRHLKLMSSPTSNYFSSHSDRQSRHLIQIIHFNDFLASRPGLIGNKLILSSLSSLFWLICQMFLPYGRSSLIFQGWCLLRTTGTGSQRKLPRLINSLINLIVFSIFNFPPTFSCCFQGMNCRRLPIDPFDFFFCHTQWANIG